MEKNQKSDSKWNWCEMSQHFRLFFEIIIVRKPFYGMLYKFADRNSSYRAWAYILEFYINPTLYPFIINENMQCEFGYEV